MILMNHNSHIPALYITYTICEFILSSPIEDNRVVIEILARNEKF